MTRRLFRAMFALVLAVVLCCMVLFLGAASAYFTKVQIRQLEGELTIAAQVVAQEGIGFLEGLDQNLDCRITWISPEGEVLYDNRSQAGEMENHLQRQEVQQALTEGTGRSTRYSGTLMERSLYVAQLLSDGTVLRLSVTQNSVLRLMLQMSESLILIVAGVLALAYVLSRRLSMQAVKPLNALDLDNPLANTRYPEIQPLLRRLDSQQRQLRAQSTQLNQRQKEFNTVTRSLNEGLVLLNTTGTVLSINPAAASLLEVTPNCLGADFSIANRNPEIQSLVDHALTGQKGEKTLSLAGGQYQAVANPVRSDGELFGVVVLLFDVTQKHQAEQLRREFTANVSHELKTPLHAISGYAELMKAGMVPREDMIRFSEKIYSETQRLVRLVEDILRLSRLDEGAADMQWETVDLYAAAREKVTELTAAAELSQVRLTLEGSAGEIRAIPQLISAIVFNLVDNAIKYNRPGGSVTIRVTPEEEAVTLEVRDTGIGIPEAHQERVFERFYRVDKSHSKAVGGTGLGLSIVKHAVRILGAQLRLESREGEGTAITIRFPREETHTA